MPKEALAIRPAKRAYLMKGSSPVRASQNEVAAMVARASKMKKEFDSQVISGQ